MSHRRTPNHLKAANLLIAGLLLLNLFGASTAKADVDVNYPEPPWYDRTVMAAHIGGSSKALFVDAGEQYAYFGQGPRLIVANVHTQPGYVTDYWISQPLKGQINAVVVRDSYAYIAADDAGLIIVDVSIPASMHVTGSFYFPNSFYDVKLSGNLAYLSTTSSGIFVVDISNPANPVQKFNYVDPTFYQFYSLVIEGNYLYAAGGPTGLVVFDISQAAKGRPASQGRYHYAPVDTLSASENRQLHLPGRFWRQTDRD